MLHRSISTRLNYSVRFAGNPIEKEETVAQHVAAMSFMALEIYNRFLNHGLDFNIRDVLYRITIHDLDESAMGDIPRPIKYYNEETKKVLDGVAQMELSKNYNEQIVKDCESAKDETFEGKVVDLLDSLQCIYRLRVSASYSKRYKSMLAQSIEIGWRKIQSIDVTKGPEYELLRDIATAEIIDEDV